MQRLDKELAERGLTQSRSQAENLIQLGHVKVDGRVAKKPSEPVTTEAKIEISADNQYVSRAALKLKSAVEKLNIDFTDAVVLDVGSSTGGFTDYALKHGAKKVIAVDVGSEQLHPILRDDERIELHEKTDVRELKSPALSQVNMVVIDVSFISLRDILPTVKKMTKNAQVLAMVKPQFEAGEKLKNKGVIKNDTMRRQILKDFEMWVKQHFAIINKADSDVSGKKGNTERFYLLKY